MCRLRLPLPGYVSRIHCLLENDMEEGDCRCRLVKLHAGTGHIRESRNGTIGVQHAMETRVQTVTSVKLGSKQNLGE
jgi:hypothetical protein